MLRPSQSVPDGTIIECDICIIGAGPAGITVARSLESAGFTTILVEAGGERLESATQQIYAGEVVNPAHPPPQMYRQRRLGGSSAIWGGRCMPFDDVDFVQRTHVPLSGWPFSREAIDPYYRQAQELVEAGEFDYSAASALDGDYLVSGFHDEHVLTDNLERYSPPTRFWVRHRAALTQSRTLTIISDATCTQLQTNDGGQIHSALCAGVDGGSIVVRGRYFVVATGGLETVRLMAHSKVGLESGWLGRNYMCHIETTLGRLRVTPRDRPIIFGFEQTREGIYVKRRFTLAAARQAELGILNAAVRVHYPSIIDPSHGESVLSALFLARKFIIPEYARHFSITDMPEFDRKYSLVDRHSAARKTTTKLGFTSRHVKNVALGLPDLLKFGAGWIRDRYFGDRKIPYIALKNDEGVYAMNLYGEQAPNWDSRVALGDTVDRYGVPRLKVDWQAQEIDYRTASTTLREIKRAMEASGCGTVEIDENQLDDEVRQQAVPVGGHHIGTARMSENRRDGVVNGHGMVHECPNLYIAGSATFPTSGQANPTLTIVALALRMADHLRDRLNARS